MKWLVKPDEKSGFQYDGVSYTAYVAYLSESFGVAANAGQAKYRLMLGINTADQSLGGKAYGNIEVNQGTVAGDVIYAPIELSLRDEWIKANNPAIKSMHNMLPMLVKHHQRRQPSSLGLQLRVV